MTTTKYVVGGGIAGLLTVGAVLLKKYFKPKEDVEGVEVKTVPLASPPNTVLTKTPIVKTNLSVVKLQQSVPDMVENVEHKVEETLKDLINDPNISLARRAEIEQDPSKMKENVLNHFCQRINSLTPAEKDALLFGYFTSGDVYEPLVEFLGGKIVHQN